MAQRDHAEQTDSAAESKFYLPAGVTPSSEASRFERIVATLLGHHI